MTTIVSVRRNGQVVVGGDGQVSLGNTVMKGNARKVRRLYNGKVLAGFAGGTADALDDALGDGVAGFGVDELVLDGGGTGTSAFVCIICGEPFR